MKPEDLGLPTKFSDWRPEQWKAVEDARNYDGKYLLQVMPTGVGKSLTYMAAALNATGRALILTSTKALQEQLLSDFSSVGLVEMKGKNNYPCMRGDGPTAEDGLCNFGDFCHLKDGGCQYYDAAAIARDRRIVVTNYHYWIGAMESIGRFNFVILDEAHSSPGILGDQLSVTIDLREGEFGLGEVIPPPRDGEWLSWAVNSTHVGKIVLEVLIKRRVPALYRRIGALFKFVSNTTKLQNIAVGDIVVEETTPGRYKIDPVDLSPFAPLSLFRGADKVILTSATVRPKTARLLGLKNFTTLEYPSCFPVENRPVYTIPTLALSHRLKEGEDAMWMLRIDQIIGQRLDRKGIIHAVSYKRAERILQGSKYRDHMVLHKPRETLAAVKQFREAKPPAVLISPAVSTGWDFPGDQCNYTIIAKVPFPDTRSPIDQARTKIDPEIPFYETLQEIVQMAGRGVRTPEDKHETFIIDDNFDWLYVKYARFVPKWFQDSIHKRKVLPPPLKLKEEV
jgi:ATP-dependent DNA helicase DinG